MNDTSLDSAAKPQNITAVALVGFGAIGQALFEHLRGHPLLRITHIVATGRHRAQIEAQVGSAAQVVDAVPHGIRLLLECAGHAALTDHVIPALARGTECALLSVGALAEPGLPERLQEAARRGNTQVHVLAGAIGGVDAIAAARCAGLDSVTYTGRKPPASWMGTPAQALFDLDHLTEPTVILQASAREAARLYPKNANVTATLSLAGLGLDATRVRLIADPSIAENIHEIDIRGTFGQMQVTMRGNPLPGNAKTSMLTVLSALRFLNNRAASWTI